MRAYDDPAMFISLRDEAELLAEARACSRPATRSLPLSAFRSPLKTISISGPADDGGLPGLSAIARAKTRPGRASCAKPARSSSARPISISSPPAWSACARPTASAQSVQSDSSPAVRAPARRRGRRRARAAFARHRYRRIGPRAGGLRQRRRPAAEPRARLQCGRGAGLPHARLRLGVRADRRRCDGDAERDRRTGCKEASRARAPLPDRPGRCRRAAARRAAARPALFFGDGFGARMKRRSAQSRSSARDRRDRHRAVLRGGAPALRGALGRRALFDVRALIASSPESILPVTRQIILAGAHGTAADAFAAFYQLDDLRRVRDHTFRSIDAMVLPTAPTIYSIEQVQADPIALNSRLGTYTNFVNLLDMCGLAVPSAMRAGWHAFRRDAAGAGARRYRAGSYRPSVSCRDQIAARRARLSAAAPGRKNTGARVRGKFRSRSSARIFRACHSTASCARSARG